MAEPWTSLHVFHRGGTDRLIVDAVGPLVRSPEIDRFFFLRYWEGGPHLRLRIRQGVVEERARAVLEEYLAAHPSTGVWDPGQYARAAGGLARAEGLEHYDRRLRLGDGVESIPYLPETEVFGGPEATDAVERHFTDSSRIALAVLGRAPERGRLLGFASAALLLALAAWEPDSALVGETLARTRPRWDLPSAREHFARQREALVGQALRCRRIATGAERASGLVGAWWTSVDTLHRRILACQAGGRFHPAPADSSFCPAGGSRERADRVVLLIRCVHLLCNRLGLSAPEEAHLRHLIGSTLGELTELEKSPWT
jgi:lantibiotic biosynthesis dehydratase-like protein